jgi:hydroxyacylglutathione hydrolase
MPLGDGVILCPAHGAGSVCGGAISRREWSTLGIERIHNPILQKTRKGFIKFKIAERLEHPLYFKKMEQMNLEGPTLLNSFPNPPALTPDQFQKWIRQQALVLDTRKPSAFGGSQIKNSYNIWLGGLPAFAGWILPYDKPILLVLEDAEHLETSVRYLIRLGYDRIEGYLCSGTEACGLESWYTNSLPIEHSGLLSIYELKERLDQRDNLIVVDVRTDKEWNEGHIEGALHIYVGYLKERLNEVPNNQPVAVICSVGNRGSIGVSILRRSGFREVYNVLGGMLAWKKAGYPII